MFYPSPGEKVASSVGDSYSGCMVALYVDSVYRCAQLQLIYEGYKFRHNGYFCSFTEILSGILQWSKVHKIPACSGQAGLMGHQLCVEHC